MHECFICVLAKYWTFYFTTQKYDYPSLCTLMSHDINPSALSQCPVDWNMTRCERWSPGPPLLTRLLVLLLWPPPHLSQHSDSSDPLAWLRYWDHSYNIITNVHTRESVRGSPGVDYPIYGMSAFSLSTFACEDRAQGVHYADPGLGCQVGWDKMMTLGFWFHFSEGLSRLRHADPDAHSDIIYLSQRNSLQPDQACVRLVVEVER